MAEESFVEPLGGKKEDMTSISKKNHAKIICTACFHGRDC